MSETLPLSEAIDNVLSFVGHELDMDKIKVEKQISPTAIIYADRKQMEEVFLNLVINACQAMPKGGTLKISDERHDGCVLIYVSDTGEGISSDQMKRIFDPFFSTKQKKEQVWGSMWLKNSSSAIKEKSRSQVEKEKVLFYFRTAE